MESWCCDLLFRQSRDDATGHRRSERSCQRLEEGVYYARNLAAKDSIISPLCVEASRNRHTTAEAGLSLLSPEDLARADCSQRQARDTSSARPRLHARASSVDETLEPGQEDQEPQWLAGGRSLPKG